MTEELHAVPLDDEGKESLRNQQQACAEKWAAERDGEKVNQANKTPWHPQNPDDLAGMGIGGLVGNIYGVTDGMRHTDIEDRRRKAEERDTARDELQLRGAALEAAIRAKQDSDLPADIVEAATIFEDFLRGNTA